MTELPGELERLRRHAEASPTDQHAHSVYLDALLEAGDEHAVHSASLAKLGRGRAFSDYLARNVSDVPEAAQWRFGFLASVSLRGFAALERVLTRSTGHLVRRLSIEVLGDEGPAVIELLRGHARALRQLTIQGQNQDYELTDLGDISSLWPSMGQLVTLIISGAISHVGHVDMPSLERLTPYPVELTPSAQRALAAMVAPKLTHLELTNDQLDFESLQILARNPSLTALHSLSIHCSNISEVLPALHGLTVKTLKLGGRTLTPADLDLLEAHVPHGLEKLTLFEHRFATEGDRTRATALAKAVALGPVHP